MGDNSHLRDIPLIITSTTSTPDTIRRGKNKRSSKKSTDSKICKSDSRKTSESKSPNGDEYLRRKSRNLVGGSLKYELRRNHSILSFPVKWSSVRVKGTGFDDSRKSVIKIPCNGIPNMNLDYQHVTSSTQGHVTNNYGNVSFSVRIYMCYSFLIFYSDSNNIVFFYVIKIIIKMSNNFILTKNLFVIFFVFGVIYLQQRNMR